MTIDAQAEIAASLRTCARKYKKDNFFLPDEITGGNDFGSIYLGHGRESGMRTDNITEAVLTTSSDSDFFIRNDSLQSLDAAAFHHSIFRTLTRFLGMDGNLSAGYDVSTNLWISGIKCLPLTISSMPTTASLTQDTWTEHRFKSCFACVVSLAEDDTLLSVVA